MKMEFDGYWDRFLSDSEPNYVITGKYLFFSDDREKLIRSRFASRTKLFGVVCALNRIQ
jgi:hypothetical protein